MYNSIIYYMISVIPYLWFINLFLIYLNIFNHLESFLIFLFSLENFKSFDNDSLKMSFISKSALTHEKSIDIDCLDLFFELKVLRKEEYSSHNFFFYVI
jgi:hypothetical protein